MVFVFAGEFDIKVGECFAHDGDGNAEIKLFDKRGFVTDKKF